MEVVIIYAKYGYEGTRYIVSICEPDKVDEIIEKYKQQYLTEVVKSITFSTEKYTLNDIN